MALYKTETHEVGKTPYIPTCYKSNHPECRVNEELAKHCGAEEWQNLHSDPVWESRFFYTDTETDYNVSPPVRKQVIKHIHGTCYRQYAGRVVYLGIDYNVRVMSDVYDDVPYAIVLNDNGGYDKVSRYTGPGWDPYTYSMPYPPTAEVDAPPRAIFNYLYFKGIQQSYQEFYNAELRRKSYEEHQAKLARMPQKGKKVRVFKGRKVPIGTVGECFWIGNSKYGQRLGMKVAGETVWVDADNCELAT